MAREAGAVTPLHSDGMSWDNLISGGLGALLGAGVTVLLYLLDRGQRERTALRALQAEVALNVLHTAALKEGHDLAGAVSSATFTAHIGAVAARIKQEDLQELTEAYMFVPHLNRLQQKSVVEGRGLSPRDLDWVVEAVTRFEVAAIILGKAVAKR